MDTIDKKIINILQQDSTLSLTELAERVNLSTTPCWKRIKRLDEEGVITARVALIDRNKVNLGVCVFVHIKLDYHDADWMASFSTKINQFEEVMACYRMAGEWDYLLQVVVEDIPAFDRFYKKLVSQIKGLSNVTSSFAMEEIKYTTRLPVL
jgi:Lrp/AsnC family transcriptional regulator